jgi:O-antigen ligase
LTGPGAGVVVLIRQPRDPGPYRPAGPPDEQLARFAIVAAFALLPVLAPAGPGNLTPADAAGLLAAVAVVTAAGWAQEPVRVPYVVGTGLLVIAGCVAALAGALPTAGLLAVGQDLYLLVWAGALATAARTAYGARFLAGAWALTAAVWGAVLVVTGGPGLLGEGGDEPAARAAFTFGDENGAGLYFVLSMLVIAAARRPRERVLRVAAITCLGLLTVATGSLGAISGLLAGVAVAAVLGVRARQGAAIAILVAVALPLGLASVALYSQRHELVAAAHGSEHALLRNSLGRGDQSSAERTQLADQTYQLWRASDAWGLGPVATRESLRAAQAPYPKEAHNDWLAALVERGVVGVIGLTLLVVEVLVWASRSWDPGRLTPGFAAALPAPHFAVGALATVLIFSLTHEVLHDRAVWALLGLLAGIGMYGQGRETSRETFGTGGWQ